jgi:hypothetical protein
MLVRPSRTSDTKRLTVTWKLRWMLRELKDRQPGLQQNDGVGCLPAHRTY